MKRRIAISVLTVLALVVLAGAALASAPAHATTTARAATCSHSANVPSTGQVVTTDRGEASSAADGQTESAQPAGGTGTQGAVAREAVAPSWLRTEVRGAAAG